MLTIIGKLDFEVDADGAYFVAVAPRLSAGCLSDMKVDEYLAILRDDLDTVAARMKVAIAKSPLTRVDLVHA